MDLLSQPNGLRICKACILPASFPGVSFNDEGVCNHCQKYSTRRERLADDKKKYKQKFLELLAEVVVKQRVRGATKRAYDVLVSYSGGKDSTYTLWLLKQRYRVRVLALTVDNHFLSPAAARNIRTVTDELGIDHLYVKPGWKNLKRIFLAGAERELYARKSLERASTICTSCMGIVKGICLKTAVEMDIPLIGYGWSPGQAPVESAIMKNNASFIRSTQQAVLKPLREIAGADVDSWFPNETRLADADKLPYNVHPLAWEQYSEAGIIEEIRKLGWTAPADTDSNSTNCLLNAYANDVHIKRYAFHPYVWEIANMVREGVMARDEGHTKIYGEQNEQLVTAAKERLFG